MSQMNRRNALQTVALGALSATLMREPVSLPFKPDSLKGLSQKLIRSHWENNYVGAAKALTAEV